MDNNVTRIGIIAVPSQTISVQLRQRLEQQSVFDEICSALPPKSVANQEGHVTLFCDMTTWKNTCVLPHRIDRLVLLGATNYDALQAFAFNAFSFLTTPLDDEQLENVCLRLKQQQYIDEIVFQWRAIQRGLSQQLGISENAVCARILRFRDSGNENVLVLKTLTDSVFLPWYNIVKIEARGDYMQVQTVDDHLIIRSSLSALLKKLDNYHFLRISRSIAVNMVHVEKVFSDDKLHHFVQFKDASVVRFSARWFEQYRNRLH